jgi:integrase
LSKVIFPRILKIGCKWHCYRLAGSRRSRHDFGNIKMARKVRDASMDSRQARTKLTVRPYCYWRTIERGAHLGYRRLRGRPGTWWGRFYIGDREYAVEALGIADDLSDADGAEVISYDEAVEKVRAVRKQRAHDAAGITGPYTVKQAIMDYLRWLDDKGKSGYDARKRAEAHILPELGNSEVTKLTTKLLHDWHVNLTKQAPRLRTKAGKKQNHRKRDESDPEEWRRQRRASANRTLTVFRAALNRAWRDGKVPFDAAWRRVEPFEAVDAARVRYLSVEEARRLINGSAADFRLLVQAALLTGCRYGELIRLTISNYNPDAGTLHIRQSKSGKGRHVVLTDEGQEFFASLCAGQPGSRLMLLKTNGEPWKAAHQARPLAAACENARISPAVNFHALRHSWASHTVMNGVPLMVVAKNLGHSDTRMVEKHYGHLSPSFVADAIRAGAPRFGIATGSKVTVLDGRGA